MVDETTIVGGVAAGTIITIAMQILKAYLPQVGGRVALGIIHVLCLLAALLAVLEAGGDPTGVTFYAQVLTGFLALALYAAGFYATFNKGSGR